MPTVPPITQNFSRPSYRPEAQSGMDPDMKRMMLVAAGLGGLVALIVGAVSLVPHAHRGVPVIEAMAGPVRVKPLDPGGMKVAGSDDATGGVEALPPAAEKPAIRALRAKSRASAAASHPASSVALAKPAPAIAPAPPVQRASATQAMPASGAVPHRVGIQLAAFDNQQEAEQDWGKLAEKNPGLFDGHRPEVARAQIAGRTVYRLRTGGFTTAEAAGAFCGKVRAKGGDCSVFTS